MKLSKESINYILDLQKKMLPIICCSNLEIFDVIKEVIINYNGRASYVLSDTKNNKKIVNTLLILMENLSEQDSFYLEKILINLDKKVVALLDAKGIDSAVYKRNLVLSFLNRDKIGIIKGTKEQVETLIKIEDDKKVCSLDANFKYRDFSKKNNVILIVEDDGYYITEGYSEFYIQCENREFLDKELLEYIYDGLLAVGVGVCTDKCEIVQAILISTLAFIISEDRVILNLKKETNSGIKYKYDKDEIIYKYMIDEIHEINSNIIENYDKIIYSFKR